MKGLLLSIILLLSGSSVMAVQDGVYAAALTPLYPDLRCNCVELAKHSKELIGQGCAGVVLFGTTGEGPSLSLAFRQKVITQLLPQQLDPNKVIIGNGASGIDDTVALASTGLSCGCTTFLIAPPSYYKGISDEGVIAYYRTIIERLGDPRLKVLLYHIPQYTGVAITQKIIQLLRSEFSDVIVGIKESEGNLVFAKALIQAFPGFQVFVGNERHIIEAVRAGGAGSICGIANLYPQLICSLYHRGRGADLKNPAEIEAFFEVLRGFPFVAAAKALMEKRHGEVWHALCPPLVPLNTAERELFFSRLEKSGLETVHEKRQA